MINRCVSVEAQIAAPADRVWGLVCDIELLPRFSDELQSAAWIDEVPGLGARFTGTNVHPLIGEWTTRCQVVQFVPPRAFAWSVGDPAKPAAVWRFEISPAGARSTLRYTAEIGPGRSGVSMLIERKPQQAEQIITGRLGQFRTGMRATVGGIKKLAENG